MDALLASHLTEPLLFDQSCITEHLPLFGQQQLPWGSHIHPSPVPGFALIKAASQKQKKNHLKKSDNYSIQHFPYF